MKLSTSDPNQQRPSSSVLDIDAVNGAIEFLQRPAEKSVDVIKALGSGIRSIVEIPKTIKDTLQYYREN